MATSFYYNLDDLPADHPGLYEPEVRTWASCIAIRTGVAAGGTAVVGLRLRLGRTHGRATRDAINMVAAAHSTPGANSSLSITLPASQISEKAGLGLAAASMVVTAGLRIREVTMRGDKGDYWLEDSAGAPRGMCEMSGTTTKTARKLFDTKRAQILKNKVVSECYTGVSRFTPHDSYFCRVR